MSDAFKREIRARMKVTGERYTQARRALLTQRDAAALAPPAAVATSEHERRDETHNADREGAPNGH
jgi:hypothetical protein